MAPFSAPTLQRPRDHHEQRRGGNHWEESSPGEGGAGATGKEGMKRLGTPLESRLAWVREPLHRWPRQGDESVSHRNMGGRWGEGGLFTSLQLLWPPRSRDSHCPRLGWFPLSAHTPGGPAHSRGDFGFCCRGHDACTRQERPAWPSVPSRQGSPGASWGGNVQPRAAPLLLQASFSPWALPSRATVSQKRDCWEEGASCASSPGTSGSSPALAVKRGRPSRELDPEGYRPRWVNTAVESGPAGGP